MPHRLRIILCASLLGVCAASVREASAQDRLRDALFDTQERLDKVEKATLLDRISLSGDYRTTLNAVAYKGPTPDQFDRLSPNDPVTREISETNEEIWSHRLRISMLAEPIDSIRVTARMTMYKLFGDGDSAPFVQDSTTTRIPRDSTPRFDQAWVDWFATDWLAFSAGRIAYADGNPAELRNNSRVRRGTWGLHMVDGEYDTINLTLNLSEALEGWYIRFFYASWFNDSDQDVFGGVPFLSSGTDNLRIVGGNMDISIPGFGDNFLQIGYYIVPEFRPFTIPIADPAFDPNAPENYRQAPATLNDSLLFPSALPDSLGSYQNISALLQFYDIGGAGLDFFFSFALGFLSPNGQGISYRLPNPENPTERVDTPFLFLSSAGDSGTTVFIYTGMRYSLPLWKDNPPKIGFEFNLGSQYHISFAVQQDNLLTKLATRGRAYEGYFILPINDYLFTRLSYVHIDADHQPGFFGPNPDFFGSTAPDAPQEIHSFSLTFNVTL